jgi:drug/metabolite transporter (DMT)-like permease
MLVMAAVFWGANGPASSLALDAGVSPERLSALRVTGAAALFLVLAAPLLRAARAGISRRGLIDIVVFGLVGISLAQWLFFQAISRFPVGLALVIIYTAPFWVATYQRIAHGLVQPTRVWIAMTVALGGVALAVLGADGGLDGLSLLGLGLSVAGAFGSATQLVLAQHLPPVPAPVRLALAMVAASVFWAAVAPWWTFPVALADDPVDIGGHATVTLGVLLAGMVVLGCAVPYYGLVRGVPLIGPAAAGVTGMLEPVIAFALGWALLGQALTPLQIVGAAVALGAVATAEAIRRAPDELVRSL